MTTEDKGIQQSVESHALTEEIVTATRQWDISKAIDTALADFAADALRPLTTEPPNRPETSGTYFPFRPLEKIAAAENVIKAWMANRSNIERAGIKPEKKATALPQGYLSAWCPIVINPMPRAGTLRGIAPDKKGLAVVIALGRLTHENGLFLGEEIEMDSGEDVIFSGGESITFPGGGGGLAILLLLNT
ncbi:hypothetical protein McanMca71_001718 [Microsporum canis]|uniref:Uncharacterized protein n=1 Tax=Arthroderma otae (strain ATCC MYA-4605 / CBS 113480) TaxID=554155 RepID=C5FXQ4_ARTOC|nr:conserved hypothetical protein [Microsporum canis CBS 113480]EEQ35094.1 conserved hypothetical protein [Microsporum canis CBS 113480]